MTDAKRETFEAMLIGGHHNSLGRTEEVVALVLEDQSRLEELYQCYNSADAVVRLRTSSAFKRVWHTQPDWLVPYFDRFLNEISYIEQPSTHWTLALMFQELNGYMSPEQQRRAVETVQRFITTSHDWIVLSNSMATLSEWAKTDDALRAWLRPHLERLAEDKRKSVAGKARKHLAALYD
jgi:hypothetical protein